jgi:DivIVA domain-containing protein
VTPQSGGALTVSTYHIAVWEGWVFGAAAAALVLRPLGELVAARLRKVPLTAVPVSVWSRLLSGVGFLGLGLSVFGYAPRWLLLVVFGLSAAVLVIPMVSRTKARLPWWRFWTEAPPAAGSSAAGQPAGSQGLVVAVDAAALSERISTATFATTKFRPGYDKEEVDNFLDELIADLDRGGRLHQAQVRDAKFTLTRLRPGYTVQEVDDLLDEVTAWPVR